MTWAAAWLETGTESKIEQLGMSATADSTAPGKARHLLRGFVGGRPSMAKGRYLVLDDIAALRAAVDHYRVPGHSLAEWQTLATGEQPMGGERVFLADAAVRAAAAAAKLGLDNSAIVRLLLPGGDATDLAAAIAALTRLEVTLEVNKAAEALGDVMAHDEKQGGPSTGDDDGEPSTASTATEAKPAMTWQEAAERLERLREQGEPWTSQRAMADKLKCSAATVGRAIEQTPELKTWAAPAGKPRAQSMTAVVTDGTAQSRELSPEDNAAIREFIETAEPEVKAWFLSLPVDEQLAHLDDPERHDRISGRSP